MLTRSRRAVGFGEASQELVSEEVLRAGSSSSWVTLPDCRRENLHIGYDDLDGQVGANREDRKEEAPVETEGTESRCRGEGESDGNLSWDAYGKKAEDGGRGG